MLELELYKDVLGLIQKKHRNFLIEKEIKNKILSMPSNPKNIISTNFISSILNFFQHDVFSFIDLLENSRNKLTQTLDFDLHEIFNDISCNSDKISGKGDLIIENLPKSTKMLVKNLFRYAIWPYIKDSYFVDRGLMKPFGYPGDYVIVEAMYEGNTKSLGLGYIYDTIFLQTQLCQGLRNRKDHMKQMLSNYLLQRKKAITILNIGCGGSRELREINVPYEGKGIDLFLMDFDQRALDFSIRNLGPKVSKAKIMPVKIDVRDLISKENFLDTKAGSIDFIYSIGLFDYLSDKVITKLLSKLLNLLGKEGYLIFAHKDYTFYNPRIADWFCDWKYYPRTQDDFRKIFYNLGSDRSLSFSKEKDGYIFFAIIRK